MPAETPNGPSEADLFGTLTVGDLDDPSYEASPNFSLETYGPIPFSEMFGITTDELRQLREATAGVDEALEDETHPEIPGEEAHEMTKRWTRYSLSLDDLFIKLQPLVSELKGAEATSFSRDRVMTEILVGRDVKYSQDFFRDMRAILDDEGQPRYSTQDIKDMCAASWGDYQLQFTDDEYEVLCDLRSQYANLIDNGKQRTHEEAVTKLKIDNPHDEERVVRYTPADGNERTLDLADYAHIGLYNTRDLAEVTDDTRVFEGRIRQDIYGSIHHLQGEFGEVDTLIDMLEVDPEKSVCIDPELRFKTMDEFRTHLETLPPKERRSFEDMETLEEVYAHVLEHLLYETLDVVVAGSGTIGHLVDAEIVTEGDIVNEKFVAETRREEYARVAQTVQVILDDHRIASEGGPIFLLPSVIKPLVKQARTVPFEEQNIANIRQTIEQGVMDIAAAHNLVSAA